MKDVQEQVVAGREGAGALYDASLQPARGVWLEPSASRWAGMKLGPWPGVGMMVNLQLGAGPIVSLWLGVGMMVNL